MVSTQSHLTWHFLRPLDINLKTTKFVLAIFESYSFRMKKQSIMLDNNEPFSHRLSFSVFFVNGPSHFEMLLSERVHFGGAQGFDQMMIVGSELMVEAKRWTLKELERCKSMVVSKLFAIELILSRLQAILQLKRPQRLVCWTRLKIESMGFWF